MKRILYIIPLMMILSCQKDEHETSPRDLSFCVSARWLDGRENTRATNNPIIDGPSGSGINITHIPSLINISCTDGKQFTATVGSHCSRHDGYTHYTPTEAYEDAAITSHHLQFRAWATLDKAPATGTTYDLGTGWSGIPAIGRCDYISAKADEGNLDDSHLQFTFTHATALVRLRFKLSDRYDKVRRIKIKSVKLGIASADEVKDSLANCIDPLFLSSGLQTFAYCYINTSSIGRNTRLRLTCTYDVYDKDATDDDAHITRPNTMAKSTFAFAPLLNSSAANIQPGKYYDLNITINPDYLYTLGDHDNKGEMTVE